MIVQEILDKLTYFSRPFPREAVEQAVVQREAITPELLRILEECTADIARTADQDYYAHTYAFFLLAQFREPRAYKVFVDFVSLDAESVDLALGETITEDLCRLLASVCGGDTSLIQGIIENPDLNEYVRSATLQTYLVLVAEGTISRSKAIEEYRSFFHGKLESEQSLVWSSLVDCACDLHPGELHAEIRQAYDDGLVDTGYIGMRKVERSLGQTVDGVMAQLRKDPRNTFISDTVSDMSGWYSFQDDPPVREPKLPKPELGWQPATIRTGPKIGRNEPCPCGSGKKYKKCCGA